MKVGDKVMISGNSDFYKSGRKDNPIDISGIVTGLSDGDLCIYVDWSNGTFNSYNECDLIIVNHDVIKRDTIVESVISQFKQRSEVGIAKYGVTLDREDLTPLEWIEHAKCEAMDFVLYLEKLKQDYGK